MTLEELAQAIEDITGKPVDPEWLEQMAAMMLAFIRVLAPCKRDEWITVEDLPQDVVTILAAALARIVMNPRGLKQETIGEYSYSVDTWSNSDVFTDMEKRVISSVAGCGGTFKSIVMGVTPPPVKMTEPDRIYFEQEYADPNDGVVFGGPYASTFAEDPVSETVTTADVQLTNPPREDVLTQEDANNLLDEEIQSRVVGDGVKTIVHLTQAEFDALEVKDGETIYVVEG